MALWINQIINNSVLIALIITILVELIVLYLLGIRRKDIFIALIGINLLTNPTMNFILELTPMQYDTVILIGLEILVVIIEGFLYYLLLRKIQQAFVISLVCNAASLVIGLWIISLLY